jgi:hypothetical protein
MTSAIGWPDPRARQTVPMWARGRYGGWLGDAEATPRSWMSGGPGSLRQSRPEALGLRLQYLRRLVKVRRLRLRAALEALDEFDQALIDRLDQLGWGAGDEEPDEPDEPEADLSPAQRTRLYRLFDTLVRRDDAEVWTRTSAGLRVPDADRIRMQLVKAGLGDFGQAEVAQAYIAFLNGDEPSANGPGRVAR